MGDSHLDLSQLRQAAQDGCQEELQWKRSYYVCGMVGNMSFQKGKLYRIRKYWWMLFPTQHTAQLGQSSCWASTAGSAPGMASMWTKEQGDTVRFLNESTLFQVIKTEGLNTMIVGTEGTGWIHTPTSLWVDSCFDRISP